MRRVYFERVARRSFALLKKLIEDN
jgi:hypothetical protein